MPKKITMTLNEHIECIQNAKNSTMSILDQMHLAEKSMEILWELLFDNICSNNKYAITTNCKLIKGTKSNLKPKSRKYSKLEQNNTVNTNNTSAENNFLILNDIKTIVCIINKLIQGYKQIFEIYQKTTNSKQKKQQLFISESIVKNIEEQLQLL